MSEGTNEVKQFSYDPLKSILKFSKMEKREKLSLQVSGIQKIDSLFPYHYDELTIAERCLEICIGELVRKWTFMPPRGNEEQKQKESNQCTIVFHSRINEQTSYWKRFKVAKSDKMAMLKLFKEYLRNGTKVEYMTIYSVPPIISELENVKLKVKKLCMDHQSASTFHSWLSLISDEQPFEEIYFPASRETMFMSQEPRVQSCNTLIVNVNADPDDEFPLDNWFASLENAHLVVECSAFPMSVVKAMIRNWVNWHRPLGTSFSLGIKYYTTVLDAFDMAQTELKGTPSTFPDLTDYFRHCCTVPLDDLLEIVIFGGPKTQQSSNSVYFACYDWELRVQVMKKGSTVPK